ncbi:type VI secretion system Vgr family protein [Polyangium aurulentum]|uniref:type VI secretion system Vgr family protein n=1 Tax=Polyangium aurulentum TaxID=2567896 RepID=UPI00146E5904|nr:type VI secretion system tip protein TssI/VgrG [Polyangium aurulentum]UQA63176.1 type VI secretion system tip protein VgrG [Polyangium aurulentum]
MIEQAALACGALGDVTIVEARGIEAMSALPRWTVDVLSADPQLDLEALLWEPATLGLRDDLGGMREIPLLVTEARYGGAYRDGHRYRLTLGVAAAALELRSGYRIFQDLTTQEIVARVLDDAGIATTDISFRLAGQYAVRTYCVQYGETEWAFLSRLLADEGINVWFDEKEDGGPLIVFGDAPTSHASIDGGMTLRFEDGSGMITTASAFFALERVAEMCHERVHVLDFDPRRPAVPTEGVAGEGALEYFEFPANVLHAEAAGARARSRLEQLQRLRVHLRGQSTCARLKPGRVVRIEGADEMFEGEFLLVEIEHQLLQASRNAAGEARPYTNRALLVPHARDRSFRPAPPSERPRIVGVETATVTGPGGEEIHVDDLGSIKVRFPWDRSGIGDDRSSRWVRCMQMSMQGSMLLPRVGWEVPVAYLDGNPDMPVALGRVYNGGAPTPYGLPAKKATSALQSATSPANGTTQEIRFSDDAGSMEAFVHATRDQTVWVGGTNTVTVSVNETHDVKKSRVVSIHGSQTIDVAASQHVTVGGDAGLKIAGARTETVGSVENIGVTGSYNLECKGAYGEVVGGLYALQCNQSNTKVQGAFTQAIGAAMSLTAGLGTNDSVAAVRMEEVGAARTFTAATAYADTVKGAKNVTAGASSDNAGADVVTNVGAVGSISVGGAATIEAGGRVAIEATTISVKVGGSITAKAGGKLEIAGKVKVSGGKLKFDTDKAQKKSTSDVGG